MAPGLRSARCWSLTTCPSKVRSGLRSARSVPSLRAHHLLAAQRLPGQPPLIRWPPLLPAAPSLLPAAGERRPPLPNPMDSTTQHYVRVAVRSARTSSSNEVAEAGAPCSRRGHALCHAPARRLSVLHGKLRCGPEAAPAQATPRTAAATLGPTPCASGGRSGCVPRPLCLLTCWAGSAERGAAGAHQRCGVAALLQWQNTHLLFRRVVHSVGRVQAADKGMRACTGGRQGRSRHHALALQPRHDSLPLHAQLTGEHHATRCPQGYTAPHSALSSCKTDCGASASPPQPVWPCLRVHIGGCAAGCSLCAHAGAAAGGARPQRAAQAVGRNRADTLLQPRL